MPPQDPSTDLTDLLPSGAPTTQPPTPGDPIAQLINNLDPTATPGTRPAQYEVQRRELLKVAAEMRKDLQALNQALQSLKLQVHKVGDWDVAQQLATKVNTAHTNMLDGINQYIAVYSAAINRIEQAAQTYGKAEHGAQQATRNASPQQPPTNVAPW